MENPLYMKVRAASTAAWWTFLVAIGLAIIQSLAAMWVLNVRPQWVSNAWGGVSWETFQSLLLTMILVLRTMVMIIFLLAIGLSIWAARLRKATVA